MTKSKKLILAVIILIYPLILIAEDHENMKAGKSFWDFLLTLKYIIVFITAAGGISIILFNKMDIKVRTIMLSVVFILFGVAPLFASQLFITPSPVCASTKPFLYGMKPQFLATLSAIGVLSVISAKGFCGTVCPIGALQELLYRIPILRDSKKFKISFKITNSVRVVIFSLFIILAFTAGTSVYFFINLFDLIHWDFNMPFWDILEFIAFLIIILGASLFLFRPFCYFICPMGLYTWVLEHFSLLKVRVKKEDCNGCGACEKEAPCTSVSSILNNERIKPDCHLCGDCITSCKQGALYFGPPKK